ncbi:hypothetical protein Acr_00g0067420 [Actinidia rufa]|uniref:Uncharacterized protein n=1 Tax=Actinidia rufa TaxID=165716 RepID=A0A7J0DRT9_9ERIC|nr:hypothetical protein Acr_00g0067420 [Actinidia rufa]
MARKFAIPSESESVGSLRTVEKPETEPVGPVNESTPPNRDLRTPCWVFCPYEKPIEKGNGMLTAGRGFAAVSQCTVVPVIKLENAT